jgi:hypothetical protein
MRNNRATRRWQRKFDAFCRPDTFSKYTRYYAYLYNSHPLHLFENISCSIEITYFRPSAISFLKFVRLLNAQESNLLDKSPISNLHTHRHNALATLPDLHGVNTAVTASSTQQLEGTCTHHVWYCSIITHCTRLGFPLRIGWWNEISVSIIME